MRRRFAIALAVGLLAVLAVIAFAFWFHRETQHRIKALLHRETLRRLEVQTETGFAANRPTPRRGSARNSG
jgi:Tfp pilus assembly protein PilV